MVPELAADALTWRIHVIDEVYRTGFVSLGLICREVRDRQLWRLMIDPETMQPFHSMSAWIVRSAPYSYRHCHSAMTALDELSDIPVDRLAEIPQCNIAQLRQMSTATRKQEDVLDAASHMSELEFAEKVEKDFPNQHLESKRYTLRMPASLKAVVDQALSLAMRVEGCQSYDEALEAVCVAYIQENGGTV